LRAVSTTIAPNAVGEIDWPCLSKSHWPTSRSIWKRLLVSAGCEMPSASDALRKLAWSAKAARVGIVAIPRGPSLVIGTITYGKNRTRTLLPYHLQ
jgi:hypothetical protein